jgi:hypothetical protein
MSPMRCSGRRRRRCEKPRPRHVKMRSRLKRR